MRNPVWIEWKKVYERESRGRKDLHVVLLGRPYTVLSRFMNKGIPDIFASLGIRVFFQDMLSCSSEAVEPIRTLLDEIHWHYASEILKAAQVTAQSHGAYPVLVTSFRCSPDSFAVDYFKKIMESHEKPYLILQLDEHASSVGYETRIESAIRAFENHHALRNRPEGPRLRTLTPSGEGEEPSEQDASDSQLGRHHPETHGREPQEGGDRCAAVGGDRNRYSEKPAPQYGAVHPPEHYGPGVRRLREGS
jgi:hypothetical protein